MRAKTVVSLVLLAFVVGSVAYLVYDEMHQDTAGTDAAPEAASQALAATDSGADEPPATRQPTDKVIAYYFHGTKRCRTCMTIEAYAGEALKSNFPDKLENGALEWRVINVDEPENEHFIKDFELTTRSVVLADIKDGKQLRWKNLTRVWELVRDKPAFASYIAEETRSFLREQND